MIAIDQNTGLAQAFYTERAKELLPSVAEWADPLAVDVILALNALDGVATTWSCSGHVGDKEAKRPRRKMYYAMVTTPEGCEVIRKIVRDTFSVLHGAFEATEFKGERNRAFTLAFKESHLWCHEHSIWYESTVIESTGFSTIQEIELANKTLAEMVQMYVG